LAIIMRFFKKYFFNFQLSLRILRTKICGLSDF